MGKPSFPKLLWLLSGLMFFYGFFLGGQQLLIVRIAGYFGLGTASQGILVSAQYLTAVAAPLLAGTPADRFGKKPLLVGFALIFSAGCLLASVSAHIGIYVVSVCLIGAGYSVCETLCSAVCSDLNEEKAAGYINLTQCLLSTGAILSPLMLQRVENWRLMYVICAAAFGVLAVFVLFTRFPTAVRQEKVTPSAGIFLRSPIFLALFLAIILYVGLENGFGYFVELLFLEKQDGSGGAYGISAYWAGMALSRLFFSLVPYPVGRTLRLSFLGAAVSFVALTLANLSWLNVLLCGLTGFCYGPIWTTLVACAAERFPERKAGAIGVMSAGCGLGGILYPTVMGIVAQQVSVNVAFAVLAASACLGAAICLTVKKNFGRSSG